MPKSEVPMTIIYQIEVTLGTINKRGEILTNYLQRENLYCMNTLLKKNPKPQMDLDKPRPHNQKGNRLTHFE